jgi:RNA-directed DNA polymerase
VLKWVAEQITGQLPLNKRCYHLKGHGGLVGAIKQVSHAYYRSEWRYAYRTDIRGYYRHIIKAQVEHQFHQYIADAVCRDLCRQWFYCSVEDGG